MTRADYMRRLVVTYGFEAPIEAAFAYTPHFRLFVDLRQRSRAGLLARDLLALGLGANDVAALPQCLVAPFSSPVEALGWMYVVERGTLVHERVRRHLRTRLVDAHDVCAYVSAYDGVTSARWNELGHIIDRVVRPDRLNLLTASACAGFRRLIDWTHSSQWAA